jgi:hypothetical protein
MFERLELLTNTGVSVYEFKPGLNVVTGDYATGKSSLFELIRFALGSRSAEIMPDIRRNLHSASLALTVGGEELVLTRINESNSIRVVSGAGLDEVWTATTGRLPRAGIRLLELLQFPVTRLARRSGAASEPLTFYDLYRYLYLPQRDVNSSVAGHADTMIRRKRQAVFEIAYGLVDSEVHDLEVRAAELRRSKEDLSSAAAAVQRFMTEAGARDLAELEVDESKARREFGEAEKRLEHALDLGRQVFGDDQGALRTRLREFRARTADLEAEAVALEITVEKGKSVVAQLQLDEEGEIRAGLAAVSLSSLEFTRCPRCLQSIRDRTMLAGHCILCGQRQETTDTDVGLEERLNRIRAQRLEAEALLADDEGSLAYVMRGLATARAELNEIAGELERQIDPARLQPSLDMSTEAATSRELARSRLRAVERDRDLWSRYHGMLADIKNLDQSIHDCEEEVRCRRAGLEENRSRIADLSTVFDEEVRQLGIVGYRHARIDDRSYLPIINDDSFDDLSVSGARKTLANVSFYLANLSMAMADSAILMPSAVILDSPRTSLGDTRGDVEAGWRLYFRMHTLCLAYPHCQIIVADNGLPNIPRNMRSEFVRSTNILELSYERPLLRDVPYPGRDQVETVGSAAL